MLGFATTSPTVMGWDWVVLGLPCTCVTFTRIHANINRVTS